VNEYQLAALLLAAIGPVLAIAGRLGAPASIVLFALGLGSAFLPGLPPVTIDPDLPLTLFLPPLIYASAVRISWYLLRFTLVPGVVLGSVLVVANVPWWPAHSSSSCFRECRGPRPCLSAR
jgi:CPA1 family monovalent cation:H+ antiporter